MAPDIEIKTILVSRKKEKKTKKNVDVFAENCKAAAAEAAEAAEARGKPFQALRKRISRYITQAASSSAATAAALAAEKEKRDK